ncbi:methyltransferase [Streptomyces sp. CB03238]|uniref:methyltransferase n=1 Tax=Streptomyces sp. CB03238 TaxID=1907777 RepID=UPI001F4E560A|nr:methyltransferase [Streptomyces sp. CB03238]
MNVEPPAVPTRSDEPCSGPDPSGEALFGTAAGECARYRPGMPDAAVRLLDAALPGVPAPVLSDPGTGTGQVPLALLPAVPRLTHVDLVLDRAMNELEPLLKKCTVSAYAGEAHTFAPRKPERRPGLVTCCRAFHWMDRPGVLAMADRVTSPHAAVVITGDGSLWTRDAEWTIALRELIQTHLGPGRHAGTRGTYIEPDRTYEDDLTASAFSDVSKHRFPIAHAWTPDRVVGHLRNTSFALPHLFADRHKAFEAEARQLLDTYDRGGTLREEAVFTVLLARRPKAAS